MKKILVLTFVLICGAVQAGPINWLKGFVTADIAGALALAQKASPVDTDGVSCYTDLAKAQAIIAATKFSFPPKLLTDSETLWLLHVQTAQLKASSACAAVCGRMANLVSSIGPLPIGIDVCAFTKYLP